MKTIVITGSTRGIGLGMAHHIPPIVFSVSRAM